MLLVIRRLSVAALLYMLIFATLAMLHDYPQLRNQLQKVRRHDPIAEQRQWLNFFYFINEAGSGMKFFVTNNEKYMYHYPSPSHVLASRKARALEGDWEMQILVARMYYDGEFAPQDRKESLRWLHLAREHAPNEKKALAVAKIIEQVNGDTAQ